MLRRRAMGEGKKKLYLYNRGLYSNGLTGFRIRGYQANSYSRQALQRNATDLYWYMTANAQIQQTLSSTEAIDMRGYKELHILGEWKVENTVARFFGGIASNTVASSNLSTALPNRHETGTTETGLVEKELVIPIDQVDYLASAWLYVRMSCSYARKIYCHIYEIYLQ